MPRRTHSITGFETEQRRIPRSGPYGGYFPWKDGQGYVIGNYTEDLSEGVVTTQMVTSLLQMINSDAELHPKPRNKLGFLWWMGLLGIAGGVTLICLGIIYGVVAIAGGVIMLLAFWCGYEFFVRRARRVRKEKIDEALRKASREVFRGVDVLIKVSTFGSYIAVEFNWRRRPAQAYNLETQGSQTDFLPLTTIVRYFPDGSQNIEPNLDSRLPTQNSDKGYDAEQINIKENFDTPVQAYKPPSLSKIHSHQSSASLHSKKGSMSSLPGLFKHQVESAKLVTEVENVNAI